jgi:DNA mismatch repair protein MutL
VIFLFLVLDPTDVDVNVHPTKIEVRWRDPNRIYSQVLSALREKFLRTDLTTSLSPQASDDPEAEARRDEVRRQAADFFKQLAASAPPGSGQPPAPSRPRPEAAWPVMAGPPANRPASDPTALWRTLSEPRRPQDPSLGGGAAGATVAAGRAPRAIQLHNAYLVCETDDGLVIIDQHALHERIIYEQLRRRIAEGSLESQRLLLPETIAVTSQQAALLQQHGDVLRTLGLDVSPFGPGTVAVHAIPSVLKDAQALSFVRDLLDRLAGADSRPTAEALIHELLDMMACKAAVKAGDPLTDDEMEALIAQRDLVERSSNCPHGRPTTLRWTVKELERQFKRT